MTFTAKPDITAAVNTALSDWTTNGKVGRLWKKDSTLWTSSGEEKWLDWLDIVDRQIARQQELIDFQAEVKAAGFANILLLGMGGSSLCPEVWKLTFGHIPGFPELHVLDSTDPAQVHAVEKQIDLKNTLVFVSSKSGSTLEPNILKQYFFDRIGIPNHFVAVTDPGSQMQRVAEEDGFRKIFYGLPQIGGRFSALSDFGMAPAAAMGLDVARLLATAKRMLEDCKKDPAENPGVRLGAILGSCAQLGRDKVTILASPAVWDLGAWLEQLIAESTGKHGKAIIPVDRESIGMPNVYGKDRLFVFARLASERAFEREIEMIQNAGHPVLEIVMTDAYELGAEFFRWEIATAVAGSMMGINPFDQPDVEASKLATRKLTTEYEETGSLPAETPLRISDQDLPERLRHLLQSISPGDYFALLAYVQMTPEHEAILGEARLLIRNRFKVATCLGFGPRFLHSTGQAYKGGPNTGVFLQITADDANDLPVPGQKYSFGVVKSAQARGDLQVLEERGRRCLRLHLGTNVKHGLSKLSEAVWSALG